MPKCASTWMQRHLFVADHGFHTIFNPAAAHVLFVEPQTLPKPGEAYWREGLANRPSPDLVPVCTSEMLAGNINGAALNSDAQAERLKAFFPEARILLMVRDQRALLSSVYKTLIAWGGAPSIRRLLADNPDNEWLHYLRFHERARKLGELYGKDNLLVLAYEDFAREPAAVLSRIKQFAGVSGAAGANLEHPVTQRVNTGSNRLTLESLRLLNTLTRTTLNPTGLIGDSERLHRFRILAANRESHALEWLSRPLQARLVRRIDQKSRGLFEQSNRLLADEFGIDCAGLGYLT